MVQLTNIDPPEFLGIDLLKPLKDFLSWIISQLMTFVGTLFGFVKEHIVMPLVNSLKWLVDKIVSTINDFISNIITTIKGLFIPSDPERIMTVLPRLVMILSFASVSTSAILTVVGSKIAGTGISVAPLSRALHSLFKVDVIMGFLVGAIFGMALRTPITYWAKKTFRPFKPDPLTLFNLYTRGYITREQLKTELAYVTGYPDKYVEGLIDIYEYNPSFFDLLRMADMVELSDEFIKQSLKVLGIKEPYYSVIFKLIKKRPIREEVRMNVSLLVTAYSKGYISREFLSTALDNLEVMPMEKQLILTFADNKRTFEILEERIYVLRTAFRKGLIDEPTIERELTKLGLQKEWINLIIAREKLFRKIEVPVPKITRAFTTEIPITTSYEYTIS